MSLRQYLLMMGVSSLLAWGAWILVVFTIDPEHSGFVGLLSFYVLLFFALVGTLALMGFFLRLLFLKQTVLFRHVAIALRQAMLFSILLVGSLLLQAHRLFTWWNVILLVLGFSILEFFFLIRGGEGKPSSLEG